NAMSLVLRISFIFSLIIHLIFRSVNLVTELLLCVNNFGIGEFYFATKTFIYSFIGLQTLYSTSFEAHLSLILNEAKT
ncbi:MAG: hypothetical protein WAJ93_28160, partial [Candidatus Nitrosopolaris sp.]